MGNSEQHVAYIWLEKSFRGLSCPECKGKGCPQCKKTGRGAPVFSRSEVIRSEQKINGHVPCFGNNHDQQRSPSVCREPKCSYRSLCQDMHRPSRFDGERIREDSIELLSKVYLCARAIERSTADWTPFQAKVAGVINQWRDDTPQIAVIGPFSAGKSTLLNRLLGCKLPSARTPTTAVVTSIRYGASFSGVVHFREVTRLTLVSHDARNPDLSAIRALRDWIRQPSKFGIDRILELEDDESRTAVDLSILVQELDDILEDKAQEPQTGMRRTIHGKSGSSNLRLDRTFEILFVTKAAKHFALDSKDTHELFSAFLTESSRALTVQKAECFLPDVRLHHLNFMDTAGLCSPVGFHAEVTAQLLQRRPDKILVLLDARRVDSPTNRVAFNVLRKFVSSPDDYRQVTFALTFWDLALKTYMTEDSEVELDYSSIEARKEASKALTKAKREEVVALLRNSVGVRCFREPMIFTLGLGEVSPPEMADSLRYLWKHLEVDCRGWVGVEMWTNRWRDAGTFGHDVKAVHSLAYERTASDERGATDDSELSGEAERMRSQREQLKIAGARVIDSIRDIVTTQRALMLVEISSLDSKSGLIGYMDSGYSKSANNSLDALQNESKRQIDVIKELYKSGERDLSPIVMDRKIMGLDASTRRQAMDEITGVMYGLKSVWDFLLGSVVELNKGKRAAAREILREQVRSTMDLLSQATKEWAITLQRVLTQADEDFSAKLQEIGLGRDERKKMAEKHRRKCQFLKSIEPHLNNIQKDINNFIFVLQEALARTTVSRSPECSITIMTDKGEMALKKGRENDVFYSNRIIGDKWFYVQIGDGGNFKKYFPNARKCKSSKVHFHTDNSAISEVICPPTDVSVFELRLSSLVGIFFKKKTDSTKPNR